VGEALSNKFPFASKFNLGMARLGSVVSTFFCVRPMLQMINNRIAIEYLMSFYLTEAK
jgi:hypothetical protein